MTSAGIPYGNYNREVVDFLNKNTEAKVVVTGYADKGTGNDVINDRIADKDI